MTTLIALSLGWKVNQVSAERRAEAEILNLGGIIYRTAPWGPTWLHALFGTDYFCHVEHVALLEPEKSTESSPAGTGFATQKSSRRTEVANAGDEAGAEPDKWVDLVCVWGSHGTHGPVTDAHLAIIASFPRVESVMIASAHITDRGLESLSRASSIESLSIDPAGSTRISDAGIGNLARLPRLLELKFAGPAELQSFAGLIHANNLQVQVPKLPPDGIACLRSLQELKELSVACAGASLDLRQIEDSVRRSLPKLAKLHLSTGRTFIAWEPKGGTLEQAAAPVPTMPPPSVPSPAFSAPREARTSKP